MAAMEIKVQAHHHRLFSAIERHVSQWPDETREKFTLEWLALRDSGAEIAETRLVGGVLQAWPSDDLTQHCAKFGIHP